MILLRRPPLRDSDKHVYANRPLLVVGGGSRTIKGDRHIVYDPGTTPMTKLQSTMLQKLGVPVERCGDSTSTLTELSGLA